MQNDSLTLHIGLSILRYRAILAVDNYFSILPGRVWRVVSLENSISQAGAGGRLAKWVFISGGLKTSIL